MELESNLRENINSHQVFASKCNYLQEFRHLDHFHPIDLLSNPVIEDEHTLNFDPYHPYSYGCSSNNNIADGDLYDEFNKACVDQNGGCGQMMDNFQSFGEYYNFHQRNQIDIMGLERTSIPLNFLEVKPVNFIVPDEVSSITSGNNHFQKAIMNKNVNFPSLLRSSKGRKKPTVIKGQWTVEEDRLLVQLVEQFGVRKWSHIAQMLPGRIGKQCRERWHNHLRPDIKKDTWSEEEDKVLIEAHTEIGNKWAEIAKRLPGRTENSIKNHWNATKRRQYSKRKCRSKYPRCSLLQNYIKNLNLDSNTTRNQNKIFPNDNTKSKSKSKSKSVNQQQVRTTDFSPNDNTKSESKSANQQQAQTTGFSPNDDTKSKSVNQHQTETTDFCPNYWTVPNFDFKDESEIYLDDNFFREGCTIDSLMEDIVSASVDEANNYGRKRCDDDEELAEIHRRSNVEMEKLQFYYPVNTAAAAAAMEFEVKKELDLVEMMSQVNEINKMK